MNATFASLRGITYLYVLNRKSFKTLRGEAMPAELRRVFCVLGGRDFQGDASEALSQCFHTAAFIK